MPMSEQERQNAAFQPDASAFGIAGGLTRGQPQLGMAGQARGQAQFGMAGQAGGPAQFRMAGQAGGVPQFGLTGQTGGQPLFGMVGQAGGQPQFGLTGQTGGQPQFGMAAQAGQPLFGLTGQTGGQPQFDMVGQAGGQAQFGMASRAEGQPHFGLTGQTGGQPYGGNQGGVNQGNANLPSMTAFQEMLPQVSQADGLPVFQSKTYEQMERESKERHAKRLKELTVIKKGWRKREREEQEIMDKRPRQEPAPIIKLLFGRKAHRPLVRKKEFNWFIEESYRIPSDSEQERRWAREEEYFRRTGKSKYLTPPYGASAYQSWSNSVGNLSSDEAESKDESSTDDSDMDALLLEEDSDPDDEKENLSYFNHITNDTQDWTKVDIPELWIECGMTAERVENLDQDKLFEEISKFITELKGPISNDEIPIGSPIDMWISIGIRNKKMFREARRQLLNFKRRRRRERIRAQGIYTSSSSEEEEVVIGGLGDLDDIKARGEGKRGLMQFLARKEMAKRRVAQKAAEQRTTREHLQAEGANHDNNNSGFVHERFDPGYDADTGESINSDSEIEDIYSDDDDDDDDDEQVVIGGLGRV